MGSLDEQRAARPDVDTVLLDHPALGRDLSRRSPYCSGNEGVLREPFEKELLASVIALENLKNGRERLKTMEGIRKRYIAGIAMVTRKEPVFIGVSQVSISESLSLRQ